MADMDGLHYYPDDPYYRLGPVHTCLYVQERETGDWDLFLGPLEWARAETGGAVRWVLCGGDCQGWGPRQNGRKMTSFRGAMDKPGAGVDNELGGSAPHQCR